MFKAKRNKLLSIAIIVLLVLYAWLAHKTHVIEYWEYIFLALFIGLHLLMHAGHGHNHSSKNDATDNSKENN
jgi:predicted tellurium resistance membrane protein TerC